MNIMALAFDTGGTVLDWHSGICKAFALAGQRHGVERDWHAVTNDYRRASMAGIVGKLQPAFNMDDVHRTVLDGVMAQHGLEMFAPQDHAQIHRAWNSLNAWPDFAGALVRLKLKFPVVSFTMLPLAMVMAVSRRNGLEWDAVISCEMIGAYKPQPLAYEQAARWMDVAPGQILMVACHNFDLNAARACGYHTAFVRRPLEWGPAGPPDPHPHPDCTIVVDDFPTLAQHLGA
ncbi:haloacid dehalogenase type II [Hydrogenophaga intermedia]|jgi:2-haloacid dehalogenase|uniref:haloacid dehalogenase type II n=1 Tax=Hydrogenophaga intermedia TaxID=65786 RepID=UPI002043DE23|nr:haloacid dehalogenase type II [Hydrogenophaga intermedia]MCM3565870.1 haloacid dehalogenase type II [Hydrogenophaga intermedia]